MMRHLTIIFAAPWLAAATFAQTPLTENGDFPAGLDNLRVTHQP
jgi:hypothetical protein